MRSNVRTIFTLMGLLAHFVLLTCSVVSLNGCNARRQAEQGRAEEVLMWWAKTFLVYKEGFNTFPPQETRSLDGERLLSWRIIGLPYFTSIKIFEGFNFQEGWNSGSNQAAAYSTDSPDGVGGSSRSAAQVFQFSDIQKLDKCFDTEVFLIINAHPQVETARRKNIPSDIRCVPSEYSDGNVYFIAVVGMEHQHWIAPGDLTAREVLDRVRSERTTRILAMASLNANDQIEVLSPSQAISKLESLAATE